MGILNKITTKTGDDGTTSLYGKGRVKKDSDLIECVGTIDELVSWIGLIKSQIDISTTKDILECIQTSLFKIATLVVTSGDKDSIEKINVKEIEDHMNIMIKNNHIPEDFIIPGKNILSSKTDIARAVCRRAERRLFSIIDKQDVDYLKESMKYLNRLSDHLFILARTFEKD